MSADIEGQGKPERAHCGQVHRVAGGIATGGGDQRKYGRSDAVWLNEPATWTSEADELDLLTDRSTDFWRDTHYGFRRDNGHFLAIPTLGDFTAQFRVRGDYQVLYDQAGIMIRLDERHWVKAGIELSDGQAMLSSVLTMDRSDWATAPYQHDARDFWVRATVAGGVLRIQVSSDGERWPLVRLAPFPSADVYFVGPMACTPEREGLHVRFSEFSLMPPIGKDLHDLS